MKMTHEQRRAEALILQAKDDIAYANIRKIMRKYICSVIAEKIRYANEMGRPV